MQMIRMYTGDDGVTHLEDMDPTQELTLPATEMVIRSAVTDLPSPWHTSPVRQILIIRTGNVKVEVEDGTVPATGPRRPGAGRGPDGQRTPRHPRRRRAGHTERSGPGLENPYWFHSSWTFRNVRLQEEEAMSTTNYCTKCGSQIGAESKFCPRCGASTEQGSSPVEAGPSRSTGKRVLKWTGLGCGGLITLLIILIIIGVVFRFGRRQRKQH